MDFLEMLHFCLALVCLYLNQDQAVLNPDMFYLPVAQLGSGLPKQKAVVKVDVILHFLPRVPRLPLSLQLMPLGQNWWGPRMKQAYELLLQQSVLEVLNSVL